MKLDKIKRAMMAGVASVAVVCMAAAPASADMSGIDVSSWQPANITAIVDYDFAVVKVSQGTTYTNPSWKTQASNVVSRDKSLGLYHYAGGGSATAEADYFLEQVADYVGTAVLVLDWESNQNSAWGDGAWVSTFVNRIHSRTKVWPIIYVQASAINQISSNVWSNCGLWVAQYANNNTVNGYQSASSVWRYGYYGEAMRQYTSSGRLSGYSGNLDLNYFRGTAEQWQAYAEGDGAVKPATGTSTTTHTTTGSSGSSSSATIRHTVKSGETMWGIATYYNAWPLSKWTVPSGNLSLIYPGNVVTYNGSTSSSGSGKRTYTVKSGDTLSGIAAKLGLSSYTQLSGYRSGNPNLIYPGEVLYY